MSAPRPGKLLDRRDREAATQSFDVNLVVTAGAGTGKTALLVERALNLIGTGATTIDRMAAVTFTEKAAAELRLRLTRGLDGLRRRAAANAPPAELESARDADRSWAFLREREDADEVRRRALAALQGLDGAAIGTLHALCADILRRHPAEAGVDPAFAVDDGPAAMRQFPAEAERFLRAELGDGAARPGVWRRALRHDHDIDTVLEIGSALSGFSIPAGATAPGAAGTHALLLEEVNTTRAALREVLERRAAHPPTILKNMGAAEILLGAFAAGGMEALRAARAEKSLQDFSHPITPDGGRRVTAAERESAEAAARRATELLRLLGRVDDEAVAALVETARPLGDGAREGLLASGFVGFDGLLRLTADLLRRSPAVRRALGRRFERMLVDEFQDTDPLQYDILFFLAERDDGQPADDPYKTRLLPGRLFIVGDPKQSIYRFRGADMTSFRRAVAHVESCGGHRLSLTSSFRSPADLLAPVNRLFRGWMGREGAWQGDHEPPYEEITSARATLAAPGPRVAIWSVESSGGADAGRAAEAAAIAAWIAAHASPVAGQGRGYRQFAILLRALTHAGVFARALRRAGVPFVVDGGREFGERAEIGDLLSFLRAAASPNDGPAMLAVLRSPMGAVSDAELARFVAAGGRIGRPDATHVAHGPDVDGARFPGVARVFRMVERFHARTGGWPVDRLVQEALADPPLALLHASAWDGAQRLANLAKLAALARRHAREGLSLLQTIAALEEEFENARREGDSPLADESLEAVRVLSIHKAKGLEFPVVFLPDIGRRPGRERGERELRVACLRDGAGALAVRLPDGRSNGAWVWHAVESRRHEEAEEKRVFYVACTRAQDRLVLVNSALKGKAPWRARLEALGYRIAAGPGFPPPGTLDGGLVEHVVVAPPAPPRVVAGDSDLESIAVAAAEFGRVVEAAAQAARPPLTSPSGTRSQDQSETDEATSPSAAGGPLSRGGPATGGGPAAAREDARRVGLIVHAALETWDRRDAGTLLDAAHHAARRLASDEPAGAPGSEVAGSAAAAGEILRGFLRSTLGARLAKAQVLGREVPILHRDASGRTWTGACDLILLEGGSIVVVDYKTDVVDGDPAVAAETYRAQLEVYRRATQAAFDTGAIAAEIWFLRSGTAVRLEPRRPEGSVTAPPRSPGR
jgi:ATP-dependent helicase/nuclease subunit A